MDASVERRSPGIDLRVHVEDGEPLSGTVVINDGTSTQFTGWLELMTLITVARTDHGD